MEKNIMPKTEAKKPSTKDTPRYVLSTDPNKAMLEMMETINRLRASLIEETKALKEADTQTFLKLQDRKLDVARDYLEGMGQLLSRKEELKTADETVKARMEDMRIEFSDIAHENHAALMRMKNGMKRLGDRIMETAREAAKKEEQLVYGATGHMQSAHKGSIGVNESA
ncbi:MAG: hypothetical protein R3D88_02385 [Alphaproteobacteria bacterium]|nr:hypothetical protein [Alphaproteobacteria bacterium]